MVQRVMPLEESSNLNNTCRDIFEIGFAIAGINISTVSTLPLPCRFERFIITPKVFSGANYRITISISKKEENCRVDFCGNNIISTPKDMGNITLANIAHDEIKISLKSFDIETVSAALGFGISVALCVNRGALFHAAGLLLDERAYLFLAPSGGGKSTVLANCSEGCCIHDDKMAVVRGPKGWLAGSVPLLNNSGKVGGDVTALAAGLYFIEKARHTRLVRAKSNEILERLTSQTYEPTCLPWVRSRLVETLFFLAAELPVFILEYQKGEDVGKILAAR